MDECNHDWHRTNGVTTEDGADTFRCKRCGATGKSYGLSGAGGVIVDTPGDRKKRRSIGITFDNRGRLLSVEKILRERAKRIAKHGGEDISGLEWSEREYKKRLAEQESKEDKE